LRLQNFLSVRDSNDYILILTEVTVFGFGMPEMVVILVFVLVVFGAGKLPEVGAALGKSIRNFRKATEDRGGIE